MLSSTTRNIPQEQRYYVTHSESFSLKAKRTQNNDSQNSAKSLKDRPAEEVEAMLNT